MGSRAAAVAGVSAATAAGNERISGEGREPSRPSRRSTHAGRDSSPAGRPRRDLARDSNRQCVGTSRQTRTIFRITITE